MQVASHITYGLGVVLENETHKIQLLGISCKFMQVVSHITHGLDVMLDNDTHNSITAEQRFCVAKEVEIS